MSNEQADHMKDRIESAAKWLKCKENCPTEFDGDPFNCELIANCLYKKVEELLVRIQRMS